MDIRFAVPSKRARAENPTARTIRYYKRQCSLVLQAAALCALVLGGVNAEGLAQKTIAVQTSAEAMEAATVDAQVTFVEPEIGASSAPIRNSTGHIDLVWAAQGASSDTPPAFELQGARSSDFAEAITYYSGLDNRSFISGLAEGAYFFRVRPLDAEARPGEWSPVLALEVDYVERWQVYLLMLIGLLCLAATITIIVLGSLRSKGASQSGF
jgi:hypothetical protein